MGVQIVEGMADGSIPAAVLYDSVTGFAFGSLFRSADDANEFLEWLTTDNAKAAAREAEITWCDDIRPYSRDEFEVMVIAWRRNQPGLQVAKP